MRAIRVGIALLVPWITILPASQAVAQTSCATTPAIAHRGITTSHTENTIGALRAAVAMSSPFEVDLRSTADDRVILMHDESLARTTTFDTVRAADGRVVDAGLVQDKTANEIAELRTNDGQHVPFVEEVLDLLQASPGTTAYLELKQVSDAAMDALTAAIVERGVTDQIELSSFSEPQLGAFLERLPGIPAYMIYGETLPYPADLRYNVSAWSRVAAQAWVDAVRSRGLDVKARHDDGGADPGRDARRYTRWDLALQLGMSSIMTDLVSNYRDYCFSKLRQPDAAVSRSSVSGYVGEGVQNATAAGQTLRLRGRRGTTHTFFVRLTNRGVESAEYAVSGSGPRPRSRVRYLAEDGDVTDAVRSSNGWRISLSPSSSSVLRIKITVLRRAVPGTIKPAVVRQTHRGAVSREDVVRAEVKVIR